MSYDVAALPFQAHDNYGTWSIDFGAMYWWLISSILHDFQKLQILFPGRQLSLTPSPFAKRLLNSEGVAIEFVDNVFVQQNFLSIF